MSDEPCPNGKNLAAPSHATRGMRITSQDPAVRRTFETIKQKAMTYCPTCGEPLTRHHTNCITVPEIYRRAAAERRKRECSAVECRDDAAEREYRDAED